MGLSRQEYQSGLPCPPPGDLSKLGIEPMCVYVSSIGRQILYHYCHLAGPCPKVTLSSVGQSSCLSL